MSVSFKWHRFIKVKLSSFFTSFILINIPLNTVYSIDTDYRKQQNNNFDEWIQSLSLQAATWGAPLVTMHALRYKDSIGPSAKSKPNEIWYMDNISTPELSQEAGYVTPNVNVIYGFGFMDLRKEPVIIEAPDSHNRYYMIEVVDMWTNAFAYAGGISTGYKGGKFILVGPDWKGDLPTEAKRIDCPTPWVLIQPRVHIYVNGQIDLEGASKILRAIKTAPLSKYMGFNKLEDSEKDDLLIPEAVHPEHPVSFLEFKDPLMFWKILAEACSENPPPKDQITAILPQYKSLGIELNKAWSDSSLPPKVVQIMKDTAQKIGSLLASIPIGTNYRGAIIPPASIGNFGADYLTRAVVGRIGLTANIPSEVIYWTYNSDNLGKKLTGENKYTITFKETPPYIEPGFWSITMYNSENNYTVPNPINRYMLGSDSKDLKKNRDGSLTIYIQNENPGKDKESNWLPAPKGLFYLIPRVYAPKPEIMEILKSPESWPIPEVEYRHNEPVSKL